MNVGVLGLGVGWIATVMTTSSYFFRNPARLRWMQAAAAVLWILYGLSAGLLPVVIANIAVAAAALFSLTRKKAQS